MVVGLSEKSALARGRIWCASSCQIHDSSNIVDPALLGVRIAMLALISCFFNSRNCCNVAVSAPRWMRWDRHWRYTWEWKDIHILSPFTVPLALVTTHFLGAPWIRSEYWNNFSAQVVQVSLGLVFSKQDFEVVIARCYIVIWGQANSLKLNGESCFLWCWAIRCWLQCLCQGSFTIWPLLIRGLIKYVPLFKWVISGCSLWLSTLIYPWCHSQSSQLCK